MTVLNYEASAVQYRLARYGSFQYRAAVAVVRIVPSIVSGQLPHLSINVFIMITINSGLRDRETAPRQVKRE